MDRIQKYKRLVEYHQGNGEGHFTALPLHKSGLYVSGEVRHIRNIRIAGRSFLIFARNNDSLKFIEVKEPLSD